MCSKYDADIVGQVMEAIVEFHKSQNVLYTLNKEAESVFEVITDKLNDQFNLKYTSASQIQSSLKNQSCLFRLKQQKSSEDSHVSYGYIVKVLIVLNTFN